MYNEQNEERRSWYQYCFINDYIGMLNPNKKQYSGSVGAAFVMLSGSQMSSQIGSTNYSVVLTGWVSVPVGGTAYTCGRINQHQSGTVQSTSYVSNDSNDNVTLTNMVKATYLSSNGDSGGIIYAHNGGANFYTAGIQSRKASNSSYSVYCKVNVINSALGVSIN